MDDLLLFPDRGHPDDFVLNEFLDGRLSPEASAELDKHLPACPACTERLEHLQTVFAGLQGLPDVVLERDLSPIILAAIDPQPQVSGFVRWGALAQLVTAAVILSLVLPKTFDAWLPFLTRAGEGLLASCVHVWNAWEMQIATWLAALRLDGLRGWSASWSRVFQPETLPLDGWPIFIALVLLFMAANGFLLRQVVRNGLPEGLVKE
ncbi:MAG: anti-sigma factor family protein [Chloroflexota bacterium]